MNRNYKFYEIIEKINEWNLGIQIKRDDGAIYELMETVGKNRKFGRVAKRKGQERFMAYTNMEHTFEVVEPEVDIQSIEEIDLSSTPTKYEVILHQLIQAVKQLDNKIKEINNK